MSDLPEPLVDARRRLNQLLARLAGAAAGAGGANLSSSPVRLGTALRIPSCSVSVP
jgi:hypothetical protein